MLCLNHDQYRMVQATAVLGWSDTDSWFTLYAILLPYSTVGNRGLGYTQSGLIRNDAKSH